MNDKLIELQHVSAAYEGKTVLQDISLTISSGDFLGIIGPNGGGKTTLIKLILSILKPTQGKILFYRDGKETNNLSIGYLPQYTNLDPQFPISVRDLILTGALTARHSSRYSPEEQQNASDILQRLSMTHMQDMPLSKLSGGWRQRALIGRALMFSPEVIILDEPETYIDIKGQDMLHDLLHDLNKTCTVILVSHDISAILQSAKNIACVNRSLSYHPIQSVNEQILEEAMGCPFQFLKHRHLPL